jgi:putative addiction module component (TIGR02574 family)
MDFDVDTLAAAVLRLPSADRVRLASQLLASLDRADADSAAHDAAWKAELDRREAAAEADPGTELPADEALAAIRAELDARRAARAAAGRAPAGRP